MDTRIGVRCLQVAVFYALLGILIGVGMAAQQDFSQKTLHAQPTLPAGPRSA